MAFSWCCPFCNHNATIAEANYSASRFDFNDNNKYGYQAVKIWSITCPNPECAEYQLSASLHDRATVQGSLKVLPEKKSWKLIPSSFAKNLPNYVPRAIVEDYNEACAIRELSPKASATLSRRCIQGMIRDFFAVKKGRLIDEIDAIKEKVDPATWAAIDAVRQIGNIGAHMEKDINVIVDVDPEEAQLLISLIETLISDWYVVKHEREERLKSLVAIAAEKKTMRQGGDS
ncbi:DUF4145 domain-containing protein [Pseudomonas nitroreducens]|uniref:DUF4145 domain-containing protein n=1 Tax=Pseudomonas nitroreducens TaxID=46680 RepID=UPI002D80C56B|nr:DUF4145 domain-containing protein [Pseudomonas nitroreducens]